MRQNQIICAIPHLSLCFNSRFHSPKRRIVPNVRNMLDKTKLLLDIIKNLLDKSPNMQDKFPNLSDKLHRCSTKESKNCTHPSSSIQLCHPRSKDQSAHTHQLSSKNFPQPSTNPPIQKYIVIDINFHYQVWEVKKWGKIVNTRQLQEIT